MKRIDRETVQRILDATDIVEVVGDFVSLRKRGANYLGLCPFHNERTPSFAVSKAKGIFKCFSCGKGGSAVSFLMDLENMSYNEALRYLAKKYNIEIVDREMTDTEREAETERESLIAVLAFAAGHFEHILADTEEGRDVGYAYFRERGINDRMIKKFRLGYSLDRGDSLLRDAQSKGFSDKFLLMAGLVAQSDRGLYDRYRGRVIYPIFSVSGRVIAFGGRILSSDKKKAKYVNSPETPVYHKSNELYGLYQARQAISKQDKCILVEGYMDVISMHQLGIENVVASSGTSLTIGQIRLLHRFTKNITVIYDADPAGIHASLRGIDLLLAEEMNIRVLLLPPGEDPDSFAQSHSLTEVEEYIAAHEVDFISFKTRILLEGVENDPIKRAGVVTEVLRSIAVVPNEVMRAEYVRQTSRMLGIDERTLALRLTKEIAAVAEKRPYSDEADTQPDAPATAGVSATASPAVTAQPVVAAPILTSVDRRRRQCEQAIVRLLLKYAMVQINAGESPDESFSMLEFVASELETDEIEFIDPLFRRIYDEVVAFAGGEWKDAVANARVKADEVRRRILEEGHEKIRREAEGLADIEIREAQLAEEADAGYFATLDEALENISESTFLSHPDDTVRRVASDLIVEKYQLSKIHTKYVHVATEREMLPELVSRAVMELKYCVIDSEIAAAQALIKAASAAPDADPVKIQALVADLQSLFQAKSLFAKRLGDRIVTQK
ncbi:MAG: DNA primase [Bacteroides sp.]|nr:DNA primase [Bacteroides sp.]MCM1456718.1 DNA primase [Lachnoclostridium sp.]